MEPDTVNRLIALLAPQLLSFRLKCSPNNLMPPVPCPGYEDVVLKELPKCQSLEALCYVATVSNASQIAAAPSPSLGRLFLFVTVGQGFRRV